MRRPLLPAGMATPERFYLQEYENEALAVTDLTAELLAAIEAGALVVNYSGHGSVNIWATERIIDNRGGAYRSDVATLTNSGDVPVCGEHELPDGLLHLSAGGRLCGRLLAVAGRGVDVPANAGAVAALMPTAMTDTDGQQVLVQCALRGDLQPWTSAALGPAVGYAKQQLLANGGAAYEETSNTFMFFGDPATSAQGAAAAAAAGADGVMAGRRHGGALLGGGAWTATATRLPATTCTGGFRPRRATPSSTPR